MSIVTKKPSIFLISVITIRSDINLPLSLICLSLTQVVCCEEIISGRTSFSFSERPSDIIFEFTIQQENWSPVFYESFISIFFSIN